MESLSIQIIAHCDNTNVPKVISFTPEQYFDLDPGEMPDVDSVPLYSDLEKYVDFSDEISRIAVEIKNNSDGRSLHIEKVFQEEKKTTVTTRCDYQNSSLTYQEIIYESALPEEFVGQERAYDVCRFVVNGQTAECVYHGIFRYTDDGKETEYRIV